MDSGGIPMYWRSLMCVTAVKLLLIASYKSTDFEVHRNWLAVTHKLNSTMWYFEHTSQWTLDYPPFFAWFEYLLSHIAPYFDTEMLKISSSSYDSESTVLFQRLSVIATDFLYVFAVYRCCNIVCRKIKTPKRDFFSDDRFILSILLMSNVGLFMVDHIHFQYNGFLFGILLISILCVITDRLLEAAFWFTVLLNFKHIFLYMAPAYFVYLLRNYCFQARDCTPYWKGFIFTNFVRLSLVVLTIFSLSFGPFILDGQIFQVLSRLFPFNRGLTHAYWAPNFWAFYNCLDKGLAFVGVQTSYINGSTVSQSSMTGGIVQEYQHVVLPSISPLVTTIISALFMLPGLIVLWRRPNEPMEFIRTLVLCTFSSFMFGWHVHEKAILMIIIPLSILAMIRADEARIYLILSTVGHFSLMPLLYEDAETPTKHLMFAMFTVYAFFSMALKYNQRKPYPLPLLSLVETIYLFGLMALQLYNGVIHSLLGWNSSYPFLPLMLTSLYCGLGVTYAWACLNWLAWFKPLRYKI